MMRKEYKSKSYLNFLSDRPCCVTGSYRNVDLHHEALVDRFHGQRKSKFDFGAVPLDHEVHLHDRHSSGMREFWDRHGLDPRKIAISQVKDYLETWPEDEELALEALEILEEGR